MQKKYAPNVKQENIYYYLFSKSGFTNEVEESVEKIMLY